MTSKIGRIYRRTEAEHLSATIMEETKTHYTIIYGKVERGSITFEWRKESFHQRFRPCHKSANIDKVNKYLGVK